MRALVTGSSGFIGTAVVNRLVGQGHEVLGVDRKEPKADTAEHQFVEADILDRERIESCFAEFCPEGMIHLAAHMSLREDGSSERYRGEYCRDEIPDGGVEGDTRNAPLDLHLDEVYLPRWAARARSALQSGQHLWEEQGGDGEAGLGVRWGLSRVVHRPAYDDLGPGMSPHYQRFLRMVKDGKYFHIGAGKVKKHMGFVGNAAAQYERLLGAPMRHQVHRKVFYITDYEPEIVSEWAEAFSRSFGAKKIHTLPKPIASLGGRVGDVIKKLVRPKFPFTSFRVKNLTTDDVCDPHLTEEVCGELPFTMEQGVEITRDWFLALEEEKSS